MTREIFEGTDLGVWAQADILAMTTTAQRCTELLAEQRSRVAERHLRSSEVFFGRYVAHLTDPHYTLSLDEDREFFTRVRQVDDTLYEELVHPLRQAGLPEVVVIRPQV